MWTITDYFGEQLFDGREFESFDDAEGYLIELHLAAYDENRWRYEVVLKES